MLMLITLLFPRYVPLCLSFQINTRGGRLLSLLNKTIKGVVLKAYYDALHAAGLESFGLWQWSCAVSAAIICKAICQEHILLCL